MVSEKKVLRIILYRSILSFFVKCLDIQISDLFLVNCVFLFTVPSDRFFDMISKLDRSVGFIPLGMLTSSAETDESIS